MTILLQIAALNATPIRAAVVDAVTRDVCHIVSREDGPVEVTLTTNPPLVLIEIAADADVTVGTPFPYELLSPAMRTFFSPGNAVAEFKGVTSASPLLTDINAVFKFGMGDDVRIGTSALVGEVEARSEHKQCRQYLVKFNDASGMPKSEWLDETDLAHTPQSVEAS